MLLTAGHKTKEYARAESFSPETMDQLPLEVFAAILAKVPFGKCKVEMQFVNRLWRDVLRSREAHSVETWAEDKKIWSDPTIVLEDGRMQVRAEVNT